MQKLNLLPTRVRRELQRATQAPLFHGTGYMSQILRDDELVMNPQSFLNLSRCPDVAAHHANNGPRDWDDGRGAIVVLDGQRVRSQFCVRQYNDMWWDYRAEAEEYLAAPISPLSVYAVGYLWLDDAAPGAGIFEPRRVTGPHRPVDLGPLGRIRERLAAIKGSSEARRLDAGTLEKLREIEGRLAPGHTPRIHLAGDQQTAVADAHRAAA